MKKLISMLGFLSLMLGLAPITSAATSDVLTGATSDLDYVYTQTSSIVSRTEQAQSTNGDSVQVFGAIGSDNQFLYMGMTNEKFDKLVFSVIMPATYENKTALDWEYSTGSSTWNNLKIISGVERFAVSGVETLTFDMPTDWNKGTFESKSAYWIRVKPGSVVRSFAWVDQISARAYNVKVTVYDSSGRGVSDLNVNDFSLSNGSDNYIYGFQSLGAGVYEFALNAETSDTTYTMTVDDSRYAAKSFSVGSVGTTKLSYSVTLGGSSGGNPVYPASDCDMPFRDLSGHWAANEVEDLYCRGIVDGRSYYYYEPNDDVTRAEFLKMVLLNAGVDVDSYRQYGESYNDVNSSDWFYVYAAAGRRLGLIDNNSSFRPEDEINRAEAVTMVVRLADVTLNGSYVPFSDVSSSEWYAKYIRAAYYADVIDGYSDGTFGPDNDLTRAEAAVVVDNAYDAWYR